MSKASLFSELPEAPLDPILGLNQQFLADPSPNKINLGVGAYRTEEGKPLILNCVKKVNLIPLFIRCVRLTTHDADEA